MNDLLIDVIYIISAVLAALFIPFELASSARSRYGSWVPLKYYLTYGHIVKGLFLAIIPICNTLLVAWIISRKLFTIIDDLNDVPVFTKRNDKR